MGLEVETTGVNKELRRMASRYEDIEEKALEHAGAELAKRLKANTPIDASSGGKHAKDYVAVGKYKDGAVQVGYSKEVAWRVHFVEYGTIKQRPRGFVERTTVEMQNKVVEIIEDYMRKELGL